MFNHDSLTNRAPVAIGRFCVCVCSHVCLNDSQRRGLALSEYRSSQICFPVVSPVFRILLWLDNACSFIDFLSERASYCVAYVMLWCPVASWRVRYNDAIKNPGNENAATYTRQVVCSCFAAMIAMHSGFVFDLCPSYIAHFSAGSNTKPSGGQAAAIHDLCILVPDSNNVARVDH